MERKKVIAYFVWFAVSLLLCFAFMSIFFVR